MRRRVLLVGHSLGAATSIKLLAEAEPNLKANLIFMIAAPFFCCARLAQSTGFKVPNNVGAMFPGNLPIFLYQGSDDEIVAFPSPSTGVALAFS